MEEIVSVKNLSVQFEKEEILKKNIFKSLCRRNCWTHRSFRFGKVNFYECITRDCCS